jgi:Trypsin-like peptidase domain/Effector-associated domain 1
MGVLAPRQMEQLSNALTAAFDTFSLNILVATRIDKRGLGYYSALSNRLEVQTFELVTQAEARDFTLKLIEAARELRPDNRELSELSSALNVAALSRGAAGRNLERTIREHNRYVDLFTFRSRLGEIEQQVCRIELPLVNQQHERAFSTGTGLLVSRNVVLTNYHVIEPLLQTTSDGWTGKPDDVVIRFDFKKIGNDVTNSGETFKLAADWLVDSSPYETTAEASAEELDYALIRLAEDAGDRPVGGWPATAGAPKRGWCVLERTNHPFTPGTELIIVQYPGGDPLKIAFDTDSIISENPAKTRVRYRTNTEAGSSGSPCFNYALDVVALHHAGDPSWRPQYNAAIPIDTILAALQTRGVAL